MLVSYPCLSNWVDQPKPAMGYNFLPYIFSVFLHLVWHSTSWFSPASFEVFFCSFNKRNQKIWQCHFHNPHICLPDPGSLCFLLLMVMLWLLFLFFTIATLLIHTHCLMNSSWPTVLFLPRLVHNYLVFGCVVCFFSVLFFHMAFWIFAAIFKNKGRILAKE